MLASLLRHCHPCIELSEGPKKASRQSVLHSARVCAPKLYLELEQGVRKRNVHPWMLFAPARGNPTSATAPPFFGRQLAPGNVPAKLSVKTQTGYERSLCCDSISVDRQNRGDLEESLRLDRSRALFVLWMPPILFRLPNTRSISSTESRSASCDCSFDVVDNVRS
jgi:hypothetical protein